MGILQGRVIFLSFVGLVALISYNATYQQNGPHPAPISAEATGADGKSRTVASYDVNTMTGSTGGPGTTASLPRSETVLSVQRRLAESGYDPGPIDGVHGVLTRASFMAYQYDNDLPVTGEAAPQLLEHMILGTMPPQASGDSEVQVPEQTVALIENVQRILGNMGYEAGPVDGIMGGMTRSAIRAFERDRELPVTGRISGRLLKEISEATGTSLASLPTG